MTLVLTQPDLTRCRAQPWSFAIKISIAVRKQWIKYFLLVSTNYWTVDRTLRPRLRPWSHFQSTSSSHWLIYFRSNAALQLQCRPGARSNRSSSIEVEWIMYKSNRFYTCWIGHSHVESTKYRLDHIDKGIIDHTQIEYIKCRLDWSTTGWIKKQQLE